MKKNLLQLLSLLIIVLLLNLIIRLIFQIPKSIQFDNSLLPYSFPSLTIALLTAFWGFVFVKTKRFWTLFLGTISLGYFSYQKFISLEHNLLDLLAGFLLGILIIYLFRTFYKEKPIWSRLIIDERFPDPLTPLFGELITKTYTQAALETQKNLNLSNKNFIPQYRLFKDYLYNNFSKSKLPKIKLLRLFINLYKKALDLNQKYNEKIIPQHQKFIKDVRDKLNKTALTNQLQLFKKIEEKFTQRMVYETMASYMIELVALRFKLILFFLTPRKIKQNYDLLSFDWNNDSKIFIENLIKLTDLKKQNSNDFQLHFDHFIKKYGFRLINYDFINPSWEENPQFVLNIIDSHLKENINPLKQLLKKFKKQEELLKWFKNKFNQPYFKFFRRQFYRWQKLATTYHLLKKKRYNSRMEYFYYLKKIALNIGRRFKEQGIILQKEDIFFLKFNEVQKLIEKPVLITRLINQRKNDWQSYFKLQPKFKIHNENDLVKINKESKKIKELRGLAANQGKIIGECKIILNQEQFINFTEGDILITKTTNPAWTSLFTKAKGVITESGGILSHAAIVSREYNLPCIVGINNVTNILKDGMTIKIDGTKGILKIL
ncbi:hypothetical protein KKF32_00775 [Patescibacteria group bacterium]|nr:hypothetical protein [Patescibacteria group bacterium]